MYQQGLIPTAPLTVGRTTTAPSRPQQQLWRRPYRVAEVALALDVHVSTIYRDIESGKPGARRLGQGRGTLRVPREAYLEYQQRLTADAATKPAAWVA